MSSQFQSTKGKNRLLIGTAEREILEKINHPFIV